MSDYDKWKSDDEAMLMEFAELYSTLEYYGFENFKSDDKTLVTYNELKKQLLQALEWAWDH